MSVCDPNRIDEHIVTVRYSVSPPDRQYRTASPYAGGGADAVSIIGEHIHTAYANDS